MKKIVRTLCYFTSKPDLETVSRLKDLSSRLLENNFEIQTTRICSSSVPFSVLDKFYTEHDIITAAGTLSREDLWTGMENFLLTRDTSLNLEINDRVTRDDVNFLFEIMRREAGKTFNFSYTFCNAEHSPFFPSANYSKEGFSIGLQSTDLAEGCNSLHTWLFRTREVWAELIQLFGDEPDFLGIDSSVAPLFADDGSFIHLIKRIHGSFGASVLTDSYLSITRFIKEENPRPAGLCGLMFPCLEDFELAAEYEAGLFTIERNIFLSLHSGLGIDTYPIGMDEDPERVREILNLLLGLAQKYQKPLSARFVSDGKTCIGEMTDFRNQYMKDVIIRKL